MARKERSWPELGEPLPAAVMDNHTHLPLQDSDIPEANGVRLSLEEQMSRAIQVRVTRMITVACSVPDFEPALRLAEEWPEVRVALGLHPNEAALHAGHVDRSPDGFDNHQEEHHRLPLVSALERVSAQLKNPLVVAVGETGLDYYRTAPSGWEAQQESFEAHLEMGRHYGLPVQIHSRDAHRDTVELLKDSASADQQIVFHSFSGDPELAAILAENGWYASFSGQLTFARNDALREALLVLPKRRVLVETDAPYLTPVPFRGAPNASYVMPYTVREMARLWQLPAAETSQLLMDNSFDLYGRC